MDFPPYPDGPFTGEYVIGGWGGTNFMTCGWLENVSALVVKSIDVWYNDATLRGIQVSYADDSRSPIFGSAADQFKSITLQPGELVTSLTLWGNGVGTRCGRILLTTNGGQMFDAGKNTDGQTSYPMDVGSGYLFGFCGRSDSDIDLLGAIFLTSPIVSVSVTDIQYTPSLSGLSSGISQVALDQAHFSNPVSAASPKDWQFSGNTTRTTSTTFTQSSSTMFGGSVNVEVSGEVFGVGAKASAGFEWQTTSTVEQSNTLSNEQSLQWGLSGTLQPGQGISCTAYCQLGQGQTRYTGNVTVTLANGYTNSYQETGIFRNVIYSNVQVSTQDDAVALVQAPQATAALLKHASPPKKRLVWEAHIRRN